MIGNNQCRHSEHQNIDDQEIFYDGAELKHGLGLRFTETQNCGFYAASEIKNRIKLKVLLRLLPLLADLQGCPGIALRHNQETEGFTSVFTVPAMVHIVGIYHPVEVGSAFGRTPANTLMHNEIVKEKIK